MKALLIVDIQNGLTNRRKLHKDSVFIDTINFAIKRFRERKNKIIFIQHNNKQLIDSTNDWEIDLRIDKGRDDLVIQKWHGDAFEGTKLETILQQDNIIEIVVCGLVSHGCVKSTCIGGLNRGFKTWILTDGHTCWNKDAADKIRLIEFELNQKGVKIIDRHEI